MNGEWLLFLTVLGCGLWPAVRKRRLLGTQALVGVCALGLLTLASAAIWSVKETQKKRTAAEFSRALPREGRTGGYVTSDACQACHPSQYESWHKTFHRTMTQFAKPETVIGNFDGVKLHLFGAAYQLERRGAEFWVEMPDSEVALNLPSRSSMPRTGKRVGILTGSHHMQVYWLPTRFGNLQMVFPFAYLLADQRWVPFDNTFLRDPNLPPTPQTWNRNCINCHSVGGQPRADPDNRTVNTRVGELGIACEACHGPGEQHVQANQNPLRRCRLHQSGQPDPTIVNPRRKPAKASSQICGQCHGIKWIPSAADHNQNGFPYRPGDDLDQTAPIVRPRKIETQPWLKEPLKRNPKFLEERYWNDGIVRVSGRDYNGMIESACFQRGDLSCLSCHSMHNSDPTNQLASDREGNQACLQCHERFRGNPPAHTHHSSGSSGSLCYNCHMPYTTYGLLKAIRSHYIDSPDVNTTRATGRPIACNLCHLDQTLDWTAKLLAGWYGKPMVELSEAEKNVSAAVRWALQGDAAQRALVAWSMGWKPAQDVADAEWLAPYIGQLLDDPYSAVRYIAYRSLKRLPGFQTFSYDFMGPSPERMLAPKQVRDRWSRRLAGTGRRTGERILIEANGDLQQDQFEHLLRSRDDRSMDLQE